MFRKVRERLFRHTGTEVERIRVWQVGKKTGVNSFFPGDSDGKEFTCNARDLGGIPVLGRSPGGGHGNPLQCSYLENPHGQRSLVGYSPWNSPGQNTGVGSLSLPQGIFPNQGLKPGLLHCRWDSSPVESPGKQVTKHHTVILSEEWTILGYVLDCSRLF